MEYSIFYYTEEEIEKLFGLHMEKQGELVVVENEAKLVLTNLQTLNSERNLIRSYIVNANLIGLSSVEIFCRYNYNNIKKLKEKKRMGLTKEKNMIDEIKEETTSYSDDSLFNITSFGTDMSFRELITMYEEGDLEKPEMQRNYVWNKNEASRFIDSVLLGLPVPSIFLAKTDDEKRLIVDGYQRIMTVYDYVKRGVFGGDGKSFALSNSENINEKWRGKTFQELQPEEQRKIRNSPIHAIVFEQKEPKDDTGMYQIFERINTSGRSLKPQEIRNCVYHGAFNKLLIELNKNQYWRKIYNDTIPDARMTDIELILRLFAFAYFSKQKEVQINQINLVKYLNQFMKRNSSFEIVGMEESKAEFIEIVQFLFESCGTIIFRNGKYDGEKVEFAKKINPAIADSVYAATQFVRKKTGLDKFVSRDLSNRYDILIRNEDYQDAVSKRTTNTEKIKKRINLATEILYGEKYEW